MRRTVFVNNPTGLHARPSSKLCTTAKKFDAVVEILHGSERANLAEILHVLSLGIGPGEVVLEASGNQAQEALDAIEKLFISNFDE